MSFDSNKSFPNEAAEVSSSPLSEMLNDLSLLLSHNASHISLEPFDVKKFEFRFKISSFVDRTSP